MPGRTGTPPLDVPRRTRTWHGYARLQLRSCSRYGACTVEELQRQVSGLKWQKGLLTLAAQCSERTLRQWSAYCKAYDAGGIVVQGLTQSSS